MIATGLHTTFGDTLSPWPQLLIYERTAEAILSPRISLCERPLLLGNGRSVGDAFDPYVWSGRASQEVSSIWFSVLHQCIRPLIGAVCCSGPPWISARGRSLYRTGLDWAIWVTSVRSRREDRSPSRRYLSQTSAGKALSALLLRHWRLLISSVPWFVLMAVPSSRLAPSTCDARRRGQGRPARAARRAWP